MPLATITRIARNKCALEISFKREIFYLIFIFIKSKYLVGLYN
jgi:hypothetical protein